MLPSCPVPWPWRRLAFLFRRRQLELDLEEEMRFHAELTGARQFGNIALLKEDSRMAWGFGPLDRFAQDLRFALRMLRKSSAFPPLPFCAELEVKPRDQLTFIAATVAVIVALVAGYLPARRAALIDPTVALRYG